MNIDLLDLIENCSLETDKSKNVLSDKLGGKSKYILENKTNKKYFQIDCSIPLIALHQGR